MVSAIVYIYLMLTLRKLSLLSLLVCLAVILAAIFIERQYMLSPCPLCMLQRIVLICLSGIFLLGSIFSLKNILRYIYTVSILFISATGFAIALRQFWLQYYAPPRLTSCSAGLERLIEVYPILDALKLALIGSAECANIDFTVMTISLAGLSTIMFGLFTILTLYVIYAQKKRRL